MSSHVFTTHIDLGELEEQDIRVMYDYTPYQPRTSTDPSWPATVQITAVEFRELDLTSDLAESDVLMGACWEHYTKSVNAELDAQDAHTDDLVTRLREEGLCPLSRA